MKAQAIAKHGAYSIHYSPLYATKVQAGFPSPADDYMDRSLDLNEHLIQHPAATFYCEVSGESMTDVGIFSGDLLIVDRSLKPRHGDVVLAAFNGELTCKLLDMHNKRLLPANKKYAPIPIHEGTDFMIEGVVTNSIRRHRCSP
jgi:DNA polymerase V